MLFQTRRLMRQWIQSIVLPKNQSERLCPDRTWSPFYPERLDFLFSSNNRVTPKSQTINPTIKQQKGAYHE